MVACPLPNGAPSVLILPLSGTLEPERGWGMVKEEEGDGEGESEGLGEGITVDGDKEGEPEG